MTDKIPLHLNFPDTIKFSDLKLSRDPVTGDIAFDWLPIELICQHSGIDSDMFRHSHEDNVAGLITAWYAEHLKAGGEPNPIVEELTREIHIEDSLGIPNIQTRGNQ